MNRFRTCMVFCLAAGISTVMVCGAASAAVSAETAYIFNTLSFLVHGFLVMWMAAGFCMLEAGLVRSRNTTVQCTKNIGLYSVAGLTFWLIGYNLMYSGVDGGLIGAPGPWSASDPSLTPDGFVADESNVYASGSDWFFQMVFVAAAGSIVSGTVAERVRVLPFLIFVVFLTAIIYPIQGSWTWGGGWLSELGFSDFAGSTIVHSVGGWAALAGALVIGARRGRFAADGRVTPMPGSNLPLATLGTFILWMGWFGFNGGSQLALGTGADAAAIAAIYINTNLAAAAGVVTAMVLTRVIYGKIDLTLALNGALGGLVAITAEPLMPVPGLAVIIGAIGGVLVVVSVPLLDKLRIDDVVGAIPVHLLCGIWGTIAVVFSNSGAAIGTQLVGIAAIGAFTFIASALVWLALKVTIGVRPEEDEESTGLDRSECGMDAYPEFGQGSQTI